MVQVLKVVTGHPIVRKVGKAALLALTSEVARLMAEK